MREGKGDMQTITLKTILGIILHILIFYAFTVFKGIELGTYV